MSALTRCRRNNRIEFKDAAGHVRNGIVLYLRSDTALVGVQCHRNPWVQTLSWDGDKEVCKRVPNNQVWVVPFTSIIRTLDNHLQSDDGTHNSAA